MTQFIEERDLQNVIHGKPHSLSVKHLPAELMSAMGVANEAFQDTIILGTNLSNKGANVEIASVAAVDPSKGMLNWNGGYTERRLLPRKWVPGQEFHDGTGLPHLRDIELFSQLNEAVFCVVW